MQVSTPRYFEGLAAVSCVLFAGCATHQATPVAEGDADRVILQVRNARTQELDIYVLTAGANREKIGSVPAASRVEFRLAARFSSGGVAFIAVPVGVRDRDRPYIDPGRPHVSREVLVEPGDRVEWRLENNLALSTLCVVRAEQSGGAALDQGSC